MSASKDAATLDGLVREILGVAREAERARVGALWDIENDFKSIARRDYAGCLSGHFSRRDLHGILAAIGGTLPQVNREQFKLMPLPDLAHAASRLGTEFRANTYKGPAGRSLRGFYVEREAGKRPLIVVNTAHHPLAVNSAFWHEVGHHLTARLLHWQERSPRLSFGGDYHEHLNDSRELVADVLVSLAYYPNSAAQRMFGTLLQGGSAEKTSKVVSRARVHLQSVSGFNFNNRIPATENLHYLAGMIHYAELRLALLAEYDI
jgi:hypothetical protein